MLKTSLVIAAAFAFTCTGSCFAQNGQPSPTTLTSPDHQILVQFMTRSDKTSTAGDGRLVYSVQFHGKPVLDESGLSLQLGDLPALGSKVHITGSDPGQGVDDYVLQNQKISKVHDVYNSVVVHAVESGAAARGIDIEARAYNSGIAFRYLLPSQGGNNQFHLRQEDTEFRLTTDATDWLLALPSYRSSYESEYVKLPTSALSNQGGVSSKFLIGLPLLMHEPGVAWLSLTEADLEGNSSMYVTNPSGNWAGHWLVSEIAPSVDHPEYAVEGTLPHHSAWRVLAIADDPGRLVESTLQYDLNPPSRVEDTSWIHPGNASWNWWVNDVDENGTPAFTTANMKHYVDFAAKSGFRYMMLDAGWSGRDITQLNGKIDVPELVRYAATKNVKVWIWCYSESVMKQMNEAFPLYEKWGVAGIKIDFINRDDQTGIKFYYDVARTAAEHHLMVDFHGTRTPWGLERTYPNVMSYEGVLGMENNKVGRRDSPVDRTVFAFTRLLAGPMDYTPGGFNNATEDGYIAQNTNPMVMGTRAQQLALYVVFQTPIQMVSDSPQMYAGQPAFQFIKDVPASWDSTHVLNGTPGEFMTIARQHDNEWYLGSITNWTQRTLQVPLSFLGAGQYTAEIYADGADADTNPKHVAIRKETVRKGQTLTLKLAAGGGCAIRFVPLRAH
ncbi:MULTISPECIES: glycoside hydrolase family 97 protein [Acidobacteriaceae]|uniref:glycoside hydrolase family 97 protein n=1 Tax=Acidobacteriaceae TaxID=204434 RepID=UPI00131B2582|nr:MULTISPECIES: glycoside hydrolase family 97 protein [Acidobacteriaceae]MDW5265977.1 glycoside hydrolase family 97 protein [Edaphobacter sp.]